MQDIQTEGWVPNARPGNDGGVGNTLEDLLGVKENNLRIPDYGKYELKARRRETSSLVTLFHCEPTSPRRVVSLKLLPFWGWKHQTIVGALSFRQTISSTRYTDRGFNVVVDRPNSEVRIDFNINMIDARHSEWLSQILSIPPDEVSLLRPA